MTLSLTLVPALTVPQQLARALQSTLISTFLDYAPSVFSPNAVPPEIDLQLVLASVEITRVLYGRISSSDLGVSNEVYPMSCLTPLSDHTREFGPRLHKQSAWAYVDILSIYITLASERQT